MKETGVLFSGPMVSAIADGRKTQTRRVVKLPKWVAALGGDLSRAFSDSGGGLNFFAPAGEQYLHVPCAEDDSVQRVYSPHGSPGDRLWVRETWASLDATAKAGCRIAYRADTTEGERVRVDAPWKPSIHMPRWASRITLEVTAVRVERVQDISRADAKAEGFWPSRGNGLESWNGRSYGNAELAFGACWRDINGPASWDANPWVWVLEFRKVTP